MATILIFRIVQYNRLFLVNCLAAINYEQYVILVRKVILLQSILQSVVVLK